MLKRLLFSLQLRVIATRLYLKLFSYFNLKTRSRKYSFATPSEINCNHDVAYTDHVLFIFIHVILIQLYILRNQVEDISKQLLLDHSTDIYPWHSHYYYIYIYIYLLYWNIFLNHPLIRHYCKDCFPTAQIDFVSRVVFAPYTTQNVFSTLKKKLYPKNSRHSPY